MVEFSPGSKPEGPFQKVNGGYILTPEAQEELRDTSGAQKEESPPVTPLESTGLLSSTAEEHLIRESSHENPRPAPSRNTHTRRKWIAGGIAAVLGAVAIGVPAWLNRGGNSESPAEGQRPAAAAPEMVGSLQKQEGLKPVEVVDSDVAETFVQDFAKEIGERREIEGSSVNGRENARYSLFVNELNPATNSIETGIRAMYDKDELGAAATETGIWASRSQKDGSIIVSVFGTNNAGEPRRIHFTTNPEDAALDKSEVIPPEQGGGIETTEPLDHDALDALLGDRQRIIEAAGKGAPIENNNYRSIKDL